ncbi:MAG: ARMT1-like domain-containing protein [Campylobacteraceae bacterium]|jgi:uncharacterized protein with ATP-grasp and redox domains|nr:ARMT1-like domain-containing protein [Campylobacteraceae bacterium]
MKIEKECEVCVLSQAKRVCDILKLNKQQSEDILKIASLHISKFNPNFSPPQNAYRFYEDIANYLGVEDIYKEFKKESSRNAKKLISICEEFLQNAEDELYCATKIAVVGNVIDLASQVQYNLKDELINIINTSFEIDDFEKLRDSLKKTKNLVYLADNAGEEVFDKIFIEVIKKFFNQIDVFYFTRGAPIINDLTFDEALEAKMDEVAFVVDSGVKTPGFILENANENALEIFKNSDLIIAKGMGNYECLSEYNGYNIFHILKVKCVVVANALNANLGSIICKKA